MGQESKLDCLNNYLNKSKRLEINRKAEHALNDSIRVWMSSGVRLAQGYKGNKWKVDGIVFNLKQDKFIGWILQVDSNEKAKLDLVQMFRGEVINGDFHFYFSGMPTLFYSRESNNKKPSTFDQLSQYARQKLVQSDIIRQDCSISNNYINSWLDDRENILKKHSKFLKDTVKEKP